MASPALRESLGRITPVGVGGVTMMLGTSRCLSLRTGASSWLLLTHIFRPERAGRGTHTHTHDRETSISGCRGLPTTPAGRPPPALCVPTTQDTGDCCVPTPQVRKLSLRTAKGPVRACATWRGREFALLCSLVGPGCVTRSRYSKHGSEWMKPTGLELEPRPVRIVAGCEVTSPTNYFLRESV